MANPHMLNIALDMFAASFNKKEEWKTEVYPLWEHAMERVKDVHLHKAILNICMKLHKYPPTLGHVVEEVKEVVRDAGGNGMEINNYIFCDDCMMNEGTRRVSAHFTILSQKKFKVHTCAARCTCDGATQKYPNMGDYKSLLTRMTNDARITLHAFHVTDRRQSQLRMQEREPQNYARMMRVIKEREHLGVHNPWMDIKDKMVDGRYVPEEITINPRPMPKTIDKPTTENYTTMRTNIDPDDCIF